MTVSLHPVTGLPEICAGDDLAALVSAAIDLQPGDIVVVTSKIVSKAQGRTVRTDDRQALVLTQSQGVVAERATPSGGVTRIVEGVAGPVMTGAGIDASNSDDLLLLPEDPDAAARSLRVAFDVPVAVLLSDTSGRPWRAGLSDFALGSSGLRVLDDLRGLGDTHGRDMAVTVRNLADEIAAAADLVKGKIDRVPVAVVRGLGHLVDPDCHDGAAQLIRTGPSDWFALGRHEAVRAALGIDPGTPAADQVGLAATGDEPVLDRLQRAIRAATYGEREVTIDLDPRTPSITLRGDDPLVVGRVWARLEVALAGERLSVDVRQDGSQISLRVHT